MSRSGYSDDYDTNYAFLYRGIVERSLKGKRGQAFLHEMAAALDAMTVKELIAEELVREDGACCAIGAVCKARSMDARKIDYECAESVGKSMGISTAMAAEIEYMNDEWIEWPRKDHAETPAERWQRMRKWVASKLHAANANPSDSPDSTIQPRPLQ